MDRFDRAGRSFASLCRIMARLRAPGGCPWDREQTFASLRPYLIEEAYEALEAMQAEDPAAHCEELGDLLLQIVFQAEIANERGDFDAAKVADGISEKLQRRHPHVFGDDPAENVAGAWVRWEQSKAKERPDKASRLDGIPTSMPALLWATRVGQKAASIGFDWPDAAGVSDKVKEEWDELLCAIAAGDEQAMEEELGDLLLTLTSLGRHLEIDPESALRAAITKFSRRFRHVEADLVGVENPLSISIDHLEELWQKAKLVK